MISVGFGLSAAVLTAAFLFGGGASLASPGDLAPQLLSLPLLYHALGPGWRRLSEARLIKIWILSVVGLIALQLAPLPPALWTALPGRELIRAMVETPAASPGWMSLSLRPQQTFKVFLALLPPVALFFGMLTLDLKRRVWMVALLVGLVLLSIGLGLVQLINGPDSPLYFYQFTTLNRAVGFFANPNHYTAPLYATLPLVAALAASLSGRHVGLMAGGFAAIAFAYLIGLSTSGSRTALLLGGVSLVASLIMVARSGVVRQLPTRRPMLVAGGLLALVITPMLLGVGLLAILDRLDTQDVFDDLRWTILPAALRQGLTYFPFGSGLGTFEKVYALNESVALVMPAYINHAHNDWIEVFYEAGVPGLFLMGLALLILVRLCVQALVSPPDVAGRLLVGGAIGAWLLLLHSLWDYPLRTEACLSVLAIALALTIAPTQANIETLSEAFPWVKRRHRRKRRRSSSGSGADADAGSKLG